MSTAKNRVAMVPVKLNFCRCLVAIAGVTCCAIGCNRSNVSTNRTIISQVHHVSQDSVIVSDRSYASDEPYDIIESNISFVNVSFENHLKHYEISTDSLRSYYVDYYLAQLRNGGFSQFVYNSDWDESIIEHVRAGLRAMGAKRHLAHFENGARLISKFGEKGLQDYLKGEYFGDNKVRDDLNAFTGEFEEISKHEDLVQLNSTWLRQLPNLVVLKISDMEKVIDRRAAAIPDREKRIAIALANEPRYKKLIRALCKCARQELSQVTIGGPIHYQGQTRIGWHFHTDQGHHFMIEADGKAMMVHEESKMKVCEIDAPEKLD